LAEYITSQQISNGQYIEPIDRIRLMSADKWEIFIKEWLDSKKTIFFKIERYGGAGDMGRDVIAYITDPKLFPKNYEWECYQCKHYKNPLMPSNVWVELGKIIYYTFLKKYPVPNIYYFVSPLGIGSDLATLLNDKNLLKTQLKNNWNKYCKNKITTSSIEITGDLLKYINRFDFSIFNSLNIENVIEEHKKTPNHKVLFGGILPPRESIEVPDIKNEKQLRYVEQLVKAYDSDSENIIEKVEDIEDSQYNGHFIRARKSFYKAEELRALTRDNLPEQIFENFKEDIYDGVINTVETKFNNGLMKARAVEDKSIEIEIDSNPLKDACRPIDKKGICHHLINDKKISWVEDE